MRSTSHSVYVGGDHPPRAQAQLWPLRSLGERENQPDHLGSHLRRLKASSAVSTINAKIVSPISDHSAGLNPERGSASIGQTVESSPESDGSGQAPRRLLNSARRASAALLKRTVTKVTSRFGGPTVPHQSAASVTSATRVGAEARGAHLAGSAMMVRRLRSSMDKVADAPPSGGKSIVISASSSLCWLTYCSWSTQRTPNPTAPVRDPRSAR